MAKFNLNGLVNLKLGQIPKFASMFNNINSSNIPQIAKLQNQMNGLNKSTKANAKDMGIFGNSVKEAFSRFTVVAAVTGTIVGFTRSVKNAVKDAILFEREMFKIAQASGQTVRQLRSLDKAISDVAVSTGVSSKELAVTARNLVQAGYSANKVKGIIKLLADTELAATFDSLNDTTEGAIAILNQFGREAQATGKEIEFLERSLSAINQVSKEYAVESADIITAVRTTGSAFESAGGNLNELIALFTSVRSTTRESAESIATGFRTIFTRIQRVDTIEALRNLGIELQDAEGKFVGPTEAVERLSTALNAIDTKDYRFNIVSEQLGGYRQIQKVIPLIQQLAVSQRALDIAQKSTGTNAADAELAQQSLAVQIEKTRETFLRFVRDLTKTNEFQFTVKFALDLANAFIKVADSLNYLLPLLSTIGGIKIAKGLLGTVSQFGGYSIGTRRRALGGPIPGSGNTDSVSAMLTPGEFVINKRAAQQIGYDNLAKLNKSGKIRKFARGGKVGGSASNSDGKENTSAGILFDKNLIKELEKTIDKMSKSFSKLTAVCDSLSESLKKTTKDIADKEKPARAKRNSGNKNSGQTTASTDIGTGIVRVQVVNPIESNSPRFALEGPRSSVKSSYPVPAIIPNQYNPNWQWSGPRNTNRPIYPNYRITTPPSSPPPYVQPGIGQRRSFGVLGYTGASGGNPPTNNKNSGTSPNQPNPNAAKAQLDLIKFLEKYGLLIAGASVGIVGSLDRLKEFGVETQRAGQIVSSFGSNFAAVKLIGSSFSELVQTFGGESKALTKYLGIFNKAVTGFAFAQGVASVQIESLAKKMEESAKRIDGFIQSLSKGDQVDSKSFTTEISSTITNEINKSARNSLGVVAARFVGGLVGSVGAGAGTLALTKNPTAALAASVAGGAALSTAAGEGAYQLGLGQNEEAAKNSGKIAEQIFSGIKKTSDSLNKLRKGIEDIAEESDFKVFDRLNTAAKEYIDNTNALSAQTKIIQKSFGQIEKAPESIKNSLDFQKSQLEESLTGINGVIAESRKRFVQQLNFRMNTEPNFNAQSFINQEVSSTGRSVGSMTFARVMKDTNNLTLATTEAQKAIQDYSDQTNRIGKRAIDLHGKMVAAQQKEIEIRTKLIGTIANQIATNNALSNLGVTLEKVGNSISGISDAFEAQLNKNIVNPDLLAAISPSAANTSDYNKALDAIAKIAPGGSDLIKNFKDLQRVSGSLQVALEKNPLAITQSKEDIDKFIKGLGVEVGSATGDLIRNAIQKALKVDQASDVGRATPEELGRQTLSNINEKITETADTIKEYQTRLNQAFTNEIQIRKEQNTAYQEMLQLQLDAVARQSDFNGMIAEAMDREVTLKEKYNSIFQRQSLLAGNLGGNPNRIGSRLRNIQNAMNGNLSAEQTGKLSRESSNLITALKELANQTDRTSAVMEEIQKIKGLRDILREFSSGLAFGTKEERKDASKAFQNSLTLAQTGNVNLIAEKDRGAVQSLLRQFKDLPIFGGATGKQVENKAISQFLQSIGAFPAAQMVANDTSNPEQQLIGELKNIFVQEQVARQQLFNLEQSKITEGQKLINTNTEAVKSLTSEIQKLKDSIAGEKMQVPGFARGGLVGGTKGTDRIPAMLSDNEYVINKDAVKKVGVKFLDRLNGGKINKMARGGRVSGWARGNPTVVGSSANRKKVEMEQYGEDLGARVPNVQSMSDSQRRDFGFDQYSSENIKAQIKAIVDNAAIAQQRLKDQGFSQKDIESGLASGVDTARINKARELGLLNAVNKRSGQVMGGPNGYSFADTASEGSPGVMSSGRTENIRQARNRRPQRNNRNRNLFMSDGPNLNRSNNNGNFNVNPEPQQNQNMFKQANDFVNKLDEVSRVFSGMEMTHKVIVDGQLNIAGINAPEVAEQIKLAIGKMIVGEVERVFNNRNRQAR